MNILAVIPARGGSKGIPRKNMRLMYGKPLIAYAIENAIACDQISHVVVSSDSEEILAFARQYDDVLVVNRDSVLARDAVTLDPVIFDATDRAEKHWGLRFDAVVTLQPTSPLLTHETLNTAMSDFVSSGHDTMISVINSPHLSWTEKDGKVVPAYEKRLNRQQLPPNYLETGAFLATRRECMSPDNRIGQDITVYDIAPEEATDIDTWQDWVACESVLGRKRVVFRSDGYKELGLGHIYRDLTLAYVMTEHDVTFLCDKRYPLGSEKLRDANMRVVEIDGESGLLEWLEENRPDVYVHDCLDTEEALIKAIKPHVGRLVTFEDLGDGARYADAVVNAIYEGASPHSNVYTGKKYVALRDEFLISEMSKFHPEVERILVLFGGTDPLDLSNRLFKIAEDYNRDGVRVFFDFILGPGYTGQVGDSKPDAGISVVRDTARVSDYMKTADMAFSSQGRTTFELAAMGVPTIVLAQNEREQLHRFAQMDNGFINIGLGSEVSDADIRTALEWLMGAESIRREMRKLMLQNDLRSGIRKVKRIILGETL